MSIHEVLERLERAVMLSSDDAAIRIFAEYEPQAGRSAKVFPPTYLPTEGTKYHFERRWEFGNDEPSLVDVVVLDSIQSQANRCEAALLENIEALGLPQILMEAEVGGNQIRVSSLQAPHRSRDAYFLDSEVDGKPFDETEAGLALNNASLGNATPFLQLAPYDLVYGVWDSHRGKRVALKFARAYTSEMLGWHAVRGLRAATKGDPYNLPGDSVPMAEWRPGDRKKDRKMSEIGHGMVPGQAEDDAGGVAVTRITRLATLSLNGLARFRFPLPGTEDITAAGRSALAALALAGDRLAFGGAGLHLRSGADLVLASERLEWVGRGGVTETFDLSIEDACALLTAAKERLGAAGFGWSSVPLRVTPSVPLRNAIERTFNTIELEGDA